MSGIAGFFNLDGRPLAPDTLQRAGEQIAHRGPDGAGMWSDGPVGFVHRMLWTTPESLHETQPLVSPDRALVITADARIDNRQELAALLDIRLSEQVSDSELILRAYEKWGAQCPAKLLGDFAFVIWDARRQELFCARDHMGIKPLYYHQAPGRLFAFGSEIKAFAGMPQISEEPDADWIRQFLSMDGADAVSTSYSAVKRLPPAHTLRVRADSFHLSRYWSLDPEREVKLRSDAEYEEALRELLRTAVTARLRSAFPVGSDLSGGLDSSTVTMLAAAELHKRNQRLHTFSLVFDDQYGCDERRYINRVLACGDFIPHFIATDNFHPAAEIDEELRIADGPHAALTIFLQSQGLLPCARASGVRCMLTGDDGDTVVSYGIERLGTLLRTGRMVKFAQECWLFTRRYHRRPWPVLRTRVLRPLFPQWAIDARRTILDLLSRRSAQSGIPHGVSAPTSRGRHLAELQSPTLAAVFEPSNKIAAAFRVERRYPFYDVRMVEFCLGLPEDQRFRQGWTRWVMRRAANMLPDAVRWRSSKADMSKFVVTRFRDADAAAVRSTLVSPALTAHGIFSDFPQHFAGRHWLQSEGDFIRIFTAFQVARWLTAATTCSNVSLTQDPICKVN